jgi:hypothetical protein
MGQRNEKQPQNGTTPYSTPEADLVVFAGAKPAPLNTLTDGTPVVAYGMVDEIREHGSVDAPRATFQLVNEFGQATYAAADSDVLADYNMWLMDGTGISVHGIVRRPFQGDADLDDPRTNYVQVLRVEPHFD